SRQTLDQYLYEFDQGYEVSYVNYSRASELADAQLIMTLERGCERKTFAFTQPQFCDVDKNLVASHGVYIASLKRSPLSPLSVEVCYVNDVFPKFTAPMFRNITPTS